MEDMQAELLTDAVHGLTTSFLAAAAPMDVPEWWLEIKGNAVEPVVVPVPEAVDEVAQAVFKAYARARAGLPIFDAPQEWPQDIKDLYDQWREAQRVNRLAVEKAHFETELKWKAFYMRQLAVALGIIV